MPWRAGVQAFCQNGSEARQRACQLVLEQYTHGAQAAVASADGADSPVWSALSSILQQLCSAAAGSPAASKLLTSSVLLPVASTLSLHVANAPRETRQPACRLLAELLNASNSAQRAGSNSSGDGSGANADASVQSVIDVGQLVKGVLQCAVEQPGSWQAQCASEAALVNAMLNRGFTSRNALAEAVLQQSLTSCADLAGLQQSCGQAMESFDTLLSASRQVDKLVRWAAVQAGSRMLQSRSSQSSDADAEADCNGESSWHLLQLVCLCGLLVQPQLDSAAALIQGSMNELAAGHQAQELQQRVALILRHAAAHKAQASAESSQAAAAAAQHLLPAASAACVSWLQSGGRGADDASPLPQQCMLNSLFTLALQGHAHGKGVQAPHAALFDRAVSSWQHLKATAAKLPDAVTSSSGHLRPLAQMLARTLHSVYSQWAGADGSAAAPAGIPVARAACLAGEVFVSVLALLSTMDSQQGAAQGWQALLQQLPELSIAQELLVNSSNASQQDAASLAARITTHAPARFSTDSESEVSTGVQLSRPLALPLAALLHVQDVQVLPDSLQLPLALALECALQPGLAAGPVLATFALHHAEVLQPDADGTSQQAETWHALLGVLAALHSSGNVCATNALLHILPQLPADLGPTLASSLFASWALPHASPDAVAGDSDKLAAVQPLVAALTATLASSQTTNIVAAREQLALEWLHHIGRQAPLLSAPAPSQTGGAGAASEATLCAAELLITLYVPDATSVADAEQQHAFSEAYTLLEELSPQLMATEPGVANAGRHIARTDHDALLEDGLQNAAEQSPGRSADGAAVSPAPPLAVGSHRLAEPAPWAAGMCDDVATAFAACAQHQLRSAVVSVQGCAQRSQAAVLQLLVLAISSGAEQVAGVLWQRALRLLQDYLSQMTVAAEDITERLCAAVVPLAQSIRGAPQQMDVAFALTFLSRLAAQPGLLSASARQAYEAHVVPLLPASGCQAAFQLLSLLRSAVATDADRFGSTQQQLSEQFADMDALALRLILCAGACLSVSSACATSHHTAANILQGPQGVWHTIAHTVARQARCAVLRTAVEEFDGWSEELGVQTFDAAVGLIAFPLAPVSLRVLALQCAAQPPLVARVALHADAAGCVLECLSALHALLAATFRLALHKRPCVDPVAVCATCVCSWLTIPVS